MTRLPLTLVLDKVARATSSRFTAATAELGISPRIVGLLTAIRVIRSPTQTDVAVWLGIGSSAVVALVDDASRLLLVVREQDETNRRQIRLRLTDLGEKKLDEVLLLAQTLDDELMKELSASERQYFESSLSSVAETLGVTAVPGGRTP